MTKITEDTIYKLDLKIIMTIIGFALIAATGYWGLVGKVEETAKNVEANTKQIAKVSNKQDEHIKNYQKMNEVVIESSVRIENIEKILEKSIERTETQLRYLIEKADSQAKAKPN